MADNISLATAIGNSASPKMYENLFFKQKESRANDEKLRKAADDKFFTDFKNYLNIPKDTYHRTVIPQVQKMYEDSWNNIKQAYKNNPNSFHVAALDELNKLKEGLMPLRDASKNLFDTEKELTDRQKSGQTTPQHDQLLNILKAGTKDDIAKLKSDPLGDYTVGNNGISLGNFSGKDKNFTQEWQNILDKGLTDATADPSTYKTRKFGIDRQETIGTKSLDPKAVQDNAHSFMASNPGLIQDVVNQNREDILAGKYSPNGKFDPNNPQFDKGAVVKDWFEKASQGHLTKSEKITGEAIPRPTEADKNKEAKWEHGSYGDANSKWTPVNFNTAVDAHKGILKDTPLAGGKDVTVYHVSHKDVSMNKPLPFTGDNGETAVGVPDLVFHNKKNDNGIIVVATQVPAEVTAPAYKDQLPIKANGKDKKDADGNLLYAGTKNGFKTVSYNKNRGLMTGEYKFDANEIPAQDGKSAASTKTSSGSSSSKQYTRAELKAMSPQYTDDVIDNAVKQGKIKLKE